MKKGSDTQIIIKALKRGAWLDSHVCRYKYHVDNFTTRVSEIKRVMDLKDRWRHITRQDGRVVRVKQYALV